MTAKWRKIIRAFVHRTVQEFAVVMERHIAMNALQIVKV
jgi:hypothetical protein